ASKVEIEFEYQESKNNLDDNKIAEIITDLLLSNNLEVSEIVQAEKNKQQQKSDNDKESPSPPVTTKEVYNAIQTVLHYEEQTNSESSLDLKELKFL
ncbi:12539_t:CDS:2, partial [Racocetra persica]